MCEQEGVNPPVENGGGDENAAGQEPEAVRAAADAVRRAREEFEKAQLFYEKIRDDATEKLRQVRQTTVGDMLDGALDAVKKHPGAGLTVAAMLGFFLGRLFRR